MQHAPTLTGVGTEEISIGNTKIRAFDCGGHEAARRVRHLIAELRAASETRATRPHAPPPNPRPPSPTHTSPRSTRIAQIWGDYMHDINAVVFMVDSMDRERLNESKIELDKLFNLEQLKDVPFLVFGNKVDTSNMPEQELRHHLNLPESMTTGKSNPRSEGVRSIEVFMCSVTRKFGYDKGFEWLMKQLP